MNSNKLLTNYPPGNDCIIPEHQRLINQYMNMDYHKISDNEFEQILSNIRNLNQRISTKLEQFNNLLNRLYNYLLYC